MKPMVVVGSGALGGETEYGTLGIIGDCEYAGGLACAVEAPVGKALGGI
jgi:hypothetical protein